MFRKLLNEWQAERIRTKFSVILTTREQIILKEFAAWLDKQRSPTLRGADSQALELLRRFYQAWQAREDDEIIDGLVLEMGAVLESA